MSCGSAYCYNASPELKFYQAFIFSVPVFFTLVLLLVFYLFYLRRRRANWQSIRMRAANLSRENPRSSGCGIKKEVREMLPVLVFKESFLIRETQCSVCLGDYQSDERLQKIPSCGHTFHVDCIDHWLAKNTTCPLCRVSLLPVSRVVNASLNDEGRAMNGEESTEPPVENNEVRIVLNEAGNEAGDRGNEARERSVVIDVQALGRSEGNI